MVDRGDAMDLRETLAGWEAIPDRWGLSADEEAAILGGSGFDGRIDVPAAWRPASLERRIRLLTSLGDALDALFHDEDRVRRWLRAPCKLAGGISPLEAMSGSSEFTLLLHDAARAFDA